MNNFKNTEFTTYSDRKYIPHFDPDADMAHEWEHNSEDADF